MSGARAPGARETPEAFGPSPGGEDAPRRPMGFLPLRVPDAFFEELPAEELDAWEGSA